MSLMSFFSPVISLTTGPIAHQGHHGCHNVSVVLAPWPLVLAVPSPSLGLTQVAHQPHVTQTFTNVSLVQHTGFECVLVGNILTPGGRAPKRSNLQQHPPQPNMTHQTTQHIHKSTTGHTKTPPHTTPSNQQHATNRKQPTSSSKHQPGQLTNPAQPATQPSVGFFSWSWLSTVPCSQFLCPSFVLCRACP